MNRLDTESTLRKITEVMLPRGTPNKTLFISLTVHVADYEHAYPFECTCGCEEDECDCEEEHPREYRYVSFLLHRPANYTSITSCITEKPIVDLKKAPWKFGFAHDSGWSSGFDLVEKTISDLIRKLQEDNPEFAISSKDLSQRVDIETITLCDFGVYCDDGVVDLLEKNPYLISEE